MNKISKVDIGLVEKPAFVKQIEKYAQAAGDKAYKDWQAISSRQDFKEAQARAEHQNRAEFGGMRKSAENKGDEAYSLLLQVGRGFGEAVEGFHAGNKAIEEFGENAKNKIAGWADAAKAELQKRNSAEKNVKFAPAAANQAQGPIVANTAAPPRIPADSLTRIGLYNFGKYSTRSLDKERNNLLREIADTLKNDNNAGVLLS